MSQTHAVHIAYQDTFIGTLASPQLLQYQLDPEHQTYHIIGISFFLPPLWHPLQEKEGGMRWLFVTLWESGTILIHIFLH